MCVQACWRAIWQSLQTHEDHFPSQLQTQKRDFVLSWLRLALDRQQHTERLQSGSPPERATPAKRIDQNPISSYEPLRSYFNNRSIAEALCALLGEYGQVRSGPFIPVHC